MKKTEAGRKKRFHFSPLPSSSSGFMVNLFDFFPSLAQRHSGVQVKGTTTIIGLSTRLRKRGRKRVAINDWRLDY
jgi:hypothetical protein